MRPAARSAAAGLLALLAARAAAGPYSGVGKLRCGFDDVTVETDQGRRKRSSWSQAYEYGVTGPLGSRALGDGRTSLAFTDGIDPNLAANTDSPRRRSLNYSFSGELFRPELRGYVRARPNFAWNETRQAGSSGQPPRTLLLNTWGLSGGGGLPGVFSVDASRQFSRRRDPASGGGVDEDARSGGESASLILGPARLSGERQFGRISDRLGTAPSRSDELRVARLETNFYELKRLGLSALSFRGEFRDQRTDQARQRQAVGDLSLRTARWNAGRWGHSAAYSALARRDVYPRSDAFTQSLALDSRTELRRGPLSHSLGASHGAGHPSSLGVTETLSLSQSFREGRVSLSETAGGGWSETAGSPARLSDNASLRLAVAPSAWRSAALLWQMAGQTVNGGGGSRSHRGELSGQQAVANLGRLSGRYERSRARDYDAQLVTTADILGAQATASPRAGLDLSAGYDLSFYRTSQRTSSSGRSANVAAEYRPRQTLSLTARLSWTATGRDASAGFNYTLGKTTLSLFAERRESGVYRRYSQLSVSLTRLL